MSWKERLAAAEKKANIAEIKKLASTPFHVDIPNGVYLCKPVSAEVRESGQRVGWMTKWLVVDGSEQDGKTLPKYQALNTDGDLERAYRDCAALGYDINSPEFSLKDNLEDICEELTETEPEVKIRVTTAKDKEDPKKEYQNFNIMSSVWPEDDEEPAPKPKAKAAEVAPAKPTKTAKPAVEEEDEEKPVARRRGRPTREETAAKAAAAEAAKKPAKKIAVEEDEDEDEPAPPVDEVEEDEEEEEEVEVVTGTVISFTFKGEPRKGKVVEVLEDDGIVRVDVDGKVFKAKIENITEVH